MSDIPEIDNITILDDKKNVILTICSNFLENKLNELAVENNFSNTDVLLLLDDIMSSLYGMITNQVKSIKGEIELAPRESNCISRTIGEFKDLWDKRLEKKANKIVRSQTSEKTLFQTFNMIDKEEKSLITTLFYSIKKCVSSE